jgi:hypothetical protein
VVVHTDAGVLGGDAMPVFPTPELPVLELPLPELPLPVVPVALVGVAVPPGDEDELTGRRSIPGLRVVGLAVKERIVTSPDSRVKSLVSGPVMSIGVPQSLRAQIAVLDAGGAALGDAVLVAAFTPELLAHLRPVGAVPRA